MSTINFSSTDVEREADPWRSIGRVDFQTDGLMREDFQKTDRCKQINHSFESNPASYQFPKNSEMKRKVKRRSRKDRRENKEKNTIQFQ